MPGWSSLDAPDGHRRAAGPRCRADFGTSVGHGRHTRGTGWTRSRPTRRARRSPARAPAGLSEREAEARRRRGEGNVAVSASSRSYARILRTNVFSFFNVILFTIGAALLALGRYNDAFTSVGLGLVNAAISAVQEIRAKRKLDRLQLLSRGRVTVVRDGRDVEVTPDGGRPRRRGARAARATRSSSTGRSSTAGSSRWTSRCSPASPSRC